MIDEQTYSARWLFPVAGQPLANGTLTIRGERITSVDAAGVRTPDVDLGNVALIPGLVNAHTHLDLSGARELIPPTDAAHFTDWLRGVIAYRQSRTPAQVQVDIRAGLAEATRYGTTLLGDISSGGSSYQALVDCPMRSVLFWELIGTTEQRFQTAVSQARDFATTHEPHQSCRLALSPHAPYSTHHTSAIDVLKMGNAAIHFAESPAEVELLATRTGPFVDFLQEFGAWEPSALTSTFSDFVKPYSHAHASRLYIHCNYLPPDFSFTHRDTIVYCPRTHAAFGHPPHPLRQYLANGIRVCLATDSLASNPNLDLLAEARLVHALHPDLPGDMLLRMVTLSGAAALGFADECGSLEPGKSADAVAVPLSDSDGNDPYELLFGMNAPEAARMRMYRGIWQEHEQL